MASPPLPSASPSLSPAPGRASRGGDHDSTAGEDKPPSPKSIPETLWALQVPLYITHSSLPNTPFVAAVPRFSYLAFLLPRLTAYFGMPCSSFHHEEIQLRNLPVGLLLDLYQPTSLPWRLVVGDGPEWDISDTFLNGAKEADFVRNNNAQQIMSLSKADTTALWNAVQDNDYAAFARVNTRLLNPATPLKSAPVRIYIPSTVPDATSAAPFSYKVIQTLVPPRTSNRTQQTLGSALRGLLPSLFPSSRDPVLANVILHGSPVPFSAPLEELMREAAYPDGWLCLIVVLL
ncbi:putative autophagy protein 5 protein [Phialemonium atrogriseum]|uniref:Autophagy protein 5 n=1 Tax=Phialemonium atrogriseum TaxID=1093897 RepID=A0AAJ0FQD2_9PEZI|nr:putative autophagy protein 5 protein [Phialemonium atrogriseum]KAK1771163.1 putative autophagy protein 5 protein [Phialemonium atrogriseum]